MFGVMGVSDGRKDFVIPFGIVMCVGMGSVGTDTQDRELRI